MWSCVKDVCSLLLLAGANELIRYSTEEPYSTPGEHVESNDRNDIVLRCSAPLGIFRTYFDIMKLSPLSISEPHSPGRQDACVAWKSECR